MAEKETRKKRYIMPPVDICETKEDVSLIADLPGVSKENLEIKITEGELTIEANAPVAEENGKKYLHRERTWGSYYLAFTLSKIIDQEKVNAKIENGVLTLTLPKHERTKPREIQIETVE